MRSFFLTVLCTVLLLGTLSSAWPWRPNGLFLGDSLDKRAATTDATTTDAATSETTATTNTASQTSSDTTTGTNSNTKTATDSETTSGTKTGTTKTKTTATSSISIDPAAAAGGVSMITPGSLSTSYYKIGEDVTFVWNYTSLSVTPSAVNVVASCSMNKQEYTLTSNMSVKATGSVVWDTGKYQSSATIPLLTATYTLFVYDASKEIDDTASAGYLSSQNGYSFGMYTPQAYTPLNEFHCATCGGAMSETSRQALKFTFGMAIITIASFTWFTGTAGIF
ncbi:hypothetical protein PENARI_c026G02845 [Penicillium arizonense]|uniref:DUF7137 domain-containing protein n=1 Tax=Penicillium arizonense TaxID=1835702 RepID=A0A1F5L6Q9_PENAI|nr:hypothetical protein PENARI_c026G02845 [Penicillium arizonense]OGE48736.1 hypothetical protein PENARI_c026G02845 [Penicillium arizonense]